MANNNLTGKDPVAIAVHELGLVEMLRGSGFVNLNNIANMFGKRIDNWKRLQSTKEILEEFDRTAAYGGAKPFLTVVGYANQASSILRKLDLSESQPIQQGTWAHPDIAIEFARWCSPKFALWCNRQIRHLLEYGEVNLHYSEWSPAKQGAGMLRNREDLEDLYGKRGD
ncbi:MAG: KilA-N domain-containing protein [Aeromonas sp.]